jgi:hypothetical protein
MTAFVETRGVRRRHYLAATTTELTLISEIKAGVTKVIESIHVVATSGGSTLTVRVKDGSTLLYPLINGATFTADDRRTSLDIPLIAGESVTVQAGANDRLYVVVVTIDDAGSKDGRQ